VTRIVVCANNIDELGGAQRVVRVLAQGFHDRGHDVTAIGVTPFEPMHPFTGDYATRILMSETWPKRSTQTERIRANLRKEAVSNMADVLRSAGGEQSVIITAQVWAMEILADALASVSPDVRRNWTVIGQYHGAYAAAASGRDLDRILRSYGPVSVFTALTAEDGAAFTAAGLNNVVAMPNPLAFWPDSVDELANDDEVAHVLYLGRLSQEKGVDLLIDAWSLIADSHLRWRLRIVGDGPERDALQQQAADLAGSDRIDWQEVTTDPGEVLGGSSLLVLPSRTEGLPLVLAEAQAYGVPVIATDCSSGVRELVGDWGMLTPRGDSRALARSLDAAMSDETWRASAGVRGRQEMEQYRLDSIIDRWETVIHRALR